MQTHKGTENQNRPSLTCCLGPTPRLTSHIQWGLGEVVGLIKNKEANNNKTPNFQNNFLKFIFEQNR